LSALNVWVCAKSLSPQAIADHHYIRPADLAFLRAKVASENRMNTGHGEKIPRNSYRRNSYWLARDHQCGVVHKADQCEVFERARLLLAPCSKDRWRN